MLSLARVQSLLLSLDSLTGFLIELAGLAATVVHPSASCGITVRYDGQPLTVSSSDERAALLDEVQYARSDGPCLQALATSEIVDVADLSVETRWPDYCARATGQGLRCSISLPLIVGQVTVGAINLYGFDQPGVFTAQARRNCELFAAQAAGAVQVLIRHARDAESLTQLEQALASRSVIDQAIGLLMGQQRCSTEEAFALLRTRSQSANIPLRTVAAGLIERLSGHHTDTGKPFAR